MKHSIWILLALVGLLTACHRVPGISKHDLSYRYDPQQQNFRSIQSVVYHSSDSFSTVYLRINRDVINALQLAADKETLPRLTYTLHAAYTGAQLLDSGSVPINIPPDTDPAAWVVVQVNVPSARGNKQVFHVRTGNETQAEHICMIDRSKGFGQQDILLTDPSGEPLFGPVLDSGQPFRLAVADAGVRELQVSHYQRQFAIALPPFAFQKGTPFDYTPDSVYTIPLDAGISPLLQLDKPGFYHFRASSGLMQGKTLFRFNEGFPAVLDAEDMLPPLEYVTTSREFGEMLQEPTKKLAVDRFWLSVTGNVGRARVRIRDFYGRVEQANMLFSSYHEGWKTDRGLIYIVYGPPKVVYRTDDTEKWIYGEPGNSHSLKFTFSRVDNPFTGEDYSLSKSPVYKESWYNAVEAWRR